MSKKAITFATQSIVSPRTVNGKINPDGYGIMYENNEFSTFGGQIIDTFEPSTAVKNLMQTLEQHLKDNKIKNGFPSLECTQNELEDILKKGKDGIPHKTLYRGSGALTTNDIVAEVFKL